MSMIQLIRIVHLLALAAWTGAVLFFSFFAALPVLDQMKTWAQQPGNWLHLKTEAEGTRLAGEFLNIVFSRYFPFQLVVALLAWVTSLWWWNAGGIGKVRILLLTLSLAGVCANYWYFAPKVHELRQQRYSDNVDQSKAANAAFGPVHNWSLAIDLLGWLCAVVALVLLVWLPTLPARE